MLECQQGPPQKWTTLDTSVAYIQSIAVCSCIYHILLVLYLVFIKLFEVAHKNTACNDCRVAGRIFVCVGGGGGE